MSQFNDKPVFFAELLSQSTENVILVENAADERSTVTETHCISAQDGLVLDRTGAKRKRQWRSKPGVRERDKELENKRIRQSRSQESDEERDRRLTKQRERM